MSTTPYTPTPGSSYNASAPQTPGTPTPSRGRQRGTVAGTGAKRGRKPRGGATGVGTTPPRIIQDSFTASATTAFSATNYQHVNWALPTGSTSTATDANQASTSAAAGTAAQSSTPTPSATPMIPAIQSQIIPPTSAQAQPQAAGGTTATATGVTPTPISFTIPASSATAPTLDTTGLLTMPSSSGTTIQTTVAPVHAVHAVQPTATRLQGIDDDGEGDDELLPAMADDDYSAQLSWQSQSKENLK